MVVNKKTARPFTLVLGTSILGGVELWERLQYVIETGRVPSARAWSLKATLTAVHVSKLIERLQKSGGAVELQTLYALADAAGVSTAWLVSGIGSIEIEAPDPRYPNRREAVNAARQAGVDERAISDVQSEQLQSAEDPPPAWWLERIMDHARRYRDPFLSATPPGRKPEDF